MTARYGPVTALHGISLRVDEGELRQRLEAAEPGHRAIVTSSLAGRLRETAVELGMGELQGTVPADEVRITRLLRRAGLRPTAVLADGTLQLNVPLETPAAMA